MRTRLAAILIAASAAAACDRMPADPLADPQVAALAGSAGERPAALTLTGLTYSAIRAVHAEHGADAARELVRDLALIQQRMSDAPAVDAAALRTALREEQARIVLHVHGDAVAARTIEAVTEQVEDLARRRDELVGSGIPVPDVSAGHAAVEELLSAAREAEPLRALDVATRAAAATDSLRMMIARAARLPSFVQLYDDAIVRLGSDPAAAELVGAARTQRSRAREALRSGDPARAQAAAESARAAEVQVILAAFGPDVAADLIGWSLDRVRQQEGVLGLTSETRDVSRLERMNESAADMLARAEVRLRRGDSAGALDLAAHAADLLNAIQATLPGS